MNKNGIKVGSVTFAAKGRMLLERNGCKAYMSRNPRPTGGEGCGYLLYTDCDIKKAVEILNKGSIRTYGIVQGGGTL